ncbi:hypothetical protein [Oceanirhabdus sp. W0125-5]|uniref:hypothetical protein n=1 Tax=Oceanirhabdus sp. W0125-5 TaxID=2999116 RepID=UPI0022F2B303|nr:hypothetical protein [Oceanirhabdus sp. W0125-5]WBW99034.1 hypothetical protein OW730_09890 [Oceanirhabdus sp. W0125-5]
MLKKLLGISLSASLLIGTPAFAAINSSNQGQVNSINDLSEKAKKVTVTGTLKLQPIYYLVEPGPNDPLYIVKLVTRSGEEYNLKASAEQFKIHEGKTMQVSGLMKNSTIFNFIYKVFQY